MTRPDNGGDQSPDLSSELWEPLGDDAFGRMLSAAMDPLATPMDLSVIPDEDEELVGDDDVAGAEVGPDTGDSDDDLSDDLDDLFGDDLAGDSSGDFSGDDAGDADDADDLAGGDGL
ncbi:hypothetical protein [uncultured Corynebacterium sp.]|uniref:hypothetical protein n=1 Tax=uncultured Corynebacterium sp. TaxID=159447 RepID=UPI0025F1C54C|nr:hypothetical protein [uncultured Corynebacterium sp.]